MMRFIQNCCFFLALFLTLSTCSTFAYTKHYTDHTYSPGSHVHDEKYVADDVSYDEDLFLNEDDEHEGRVFNGHGFSNTPSVQDFLLSSQSKSLSGLFFAKQVHQDYLLEESTSEKSTTSR